MKYVYVVIAPHAAWELAKRAFSTLDAAKTWVVAELDAGLRLDEGETVEWYEPEPAIHVLADKDISERWSYQIQEMEVYE